MTTTRSTHVRLPVQAQQQLERLIEATGLTQTGVIVTAIDRMYQQHQQERTMQYLIHRDPAGTEIVGRIVGSCDTVRDAAALLGISDDQFDGDSPRYVYDWLELVNEIDDDTTTDPNSIQTMTLEQLTYAVFHAAYPDSYGEPNPDKIAEIGEWLSGPGGWADYADADSLAAEWRQVEAEAEWATE